MKKIYRIQTLILLFIFALFVSSCNYATHYIQTGGKTYPQTNPQEIQIFSGEPTQEYTVIGSIAIDCLGDGAEARAYLQEKAALLGADAVIFSQIFNLSTDRTSIGISGVAVKFNK